ncbi:MAG: histidine phosphatase family protein [Oscillospiraceae bacterium]
MKIALIRHSITQGNLERRYVGRTDEPLCAQGRALALHCASLVPQVEQVLSSPMLRAVQTATLLYPSQTIEVMSGLEECDFGVWEGKTHAELCQIPSYHEWVTAAGILPPPGGENPDCFLVRCRTSFENALTRLKAQHAASAAFVLHGGVIMAVMSQLVTPVRGFYDWQTKNCQGFLLESAADGLVLLSDIGNVACANESSQSTKFFARSET